MQVIGNVENDHHFDIDGLDTGLMKVGLTVSGVQDLRNSHRSSHRIAA
jgi:hypothetical protein